MEVVYVGGRPRAARAARCLRSVGLFALLALFGVAGWAGTASAAAARHVQYRGYRIAVPAGWPVYDLSAHPTVCVRFNRHAVYLGRPGSAQRCPAHAAGRTESILIEPLTASAAGAAPSANPGARLSGGSVAQLALPARGVIVTATWARHPATVERALGRRSLPAGTAAAAGTAPATGTASAASAARSARPLVRRAGASAAAVFTGLGFDACTAPSTLAMAAWTASPYHAVGIYLGGADSACAQPNLSAAWVSAESAAGWHLIPTYVGLQAPSNSCGCRAIAPAKASAQGAAAAQDAIVQAQTLGIGRGSPIYDDMEAFPLSTKNDAAVLAYLAAWTNALHAGGYVSGVYSSANSGIRLLASQTGTSFVEPDDIWIASWNGQQSTADPNVPSTEWAAHQRIHQYQGGHTSTYGGVKLDIDSNYLDGATAVGTLAPTLTPALAPTARILPMVDGSVEIQASWIGEPGISSWQLYGGDSPATLAAIGTPVTGGAATLITVHSQLAYFAVQALGSTVQALESGALLLGTSPVLATPAHLAVYGRSAFVPAHGLAGLPVGCFTTGPCRLTTSISIGSSVLASTGPESIPAYGGGVVYFKLTPAGRARLAAAAHHRLPVRVRVRDVSGTSLSTTLNLVPFLTQGRAPHRSLTGSPSLRLVGATDFVFRDYVGGILASCLSATPCRVSTKISMAGRTIASTTPEYLGAHELGYLIFKLTGHGRASLASAKGNQVGATVTITAAGAAAGAGAGAGVGAGARASGHVVLISYT